MPIYEFVCNKCGAEEELLVSISEAESGKLRCEVCGGKLKRVFSVTADSRASGSGARAESSSCAGTGG